MAKVISQAKAERVAKLMTAELKKKMWLLRVC